jgi:hypothetical protein
MITNTNIRIRMERNTPTLMAMNILMGMAMNMHIRMITERIQVMGTSTARRS